jgi:hypothetical protein
VVEQGQMVVLVVLVVLVVDRLVFKLEEVA